jgi:hypothetical protein
MILVKVNLKLMVTSNMQLFAIFAGNFLKF